MSVRQRVEDAHFLLANGRIEGALLSACVAVAATSRARYPDRTKMRDRRAFIEFLGEEMRVLTAGAITNVNLKYPSADISQYPNKMMPLQDILYEFVRCTLAHEGRLGSSVKFLEGDAMTIEVDEECISLGGAFLQRLLLVLIYAPENFSEYPEISAMPIEVAGWNLFGIRRDNHEDYLMARQERITAL
jgi:hypothetical protein